jgi:hypothetical protein
MISHVFCPKETCFLEFTYTVAVILVKQVLRIALGSVIRISYKRAKCFHQSFVIFVCVCARTCVHAFL